MQVKTTARREEAQESGLWDFVEAGFEMLEAVAEVAAAALEALGPLLELLACLGA